MPTGRYSIISSVVNNVVYVFGGCDSITPSNTNEALTNATLNFSSIPSTLPSSTSTLSSTLSPSTSLNNKSKKVHQIQIQWKHFFLQIILGLH